MLEGFLLKCGKKYYFFKTVYTTKNNYLASKILRKLELPENPDTISEIKYWLNKATLEKHYFTKDTGDYKKGDVWYSIHGTGNDVFGGCYDANEVTIIELY